MPETPFSGEPVFSSPFTEGDVINVPPQSFFILQETGDRIILEDGSGFKLTEMAMQEAT